MPATPSDLIYDPYDYAIDADPHPIWKRMRDEAPVYYNETHDFYTLTRYEDVHAALKDVETFSSAKGSVLELIKSPQLPDFSGNMLFLDPPEHDQLRSLIGRRFTPKGVLGLDPQIRAICSGYLDRFVGSDGFDFVQDFGALIPMMVICTFMGIPPEDHDAIRMLADATLHHEEGDTEGNLEAVMAMARYMDGSVALRQFFPRDDFMSELIAAEVTVEDGSKKKLDAKQLVQYLGLVAGGGNETVGRMMSWSGALLAQHPEQRAMLVDDPRLIPQAIEEIIRFEAPSPVQARYVTRDVTLHGVTIPAGSAALLLNNSANRDERVFPDPDRFDITRDTKQHLGFGFGVHFCVGAALARLEGRVALEETLRRFPTWDVDWENAERVHTSTVRGYSRLPITLP